MATTNFGLLTNEQKTIWSTDMWSQARNLSFINKFLGKDENSVIQHVTDLTKTQRGARAVITLVNDLEGDGVVGDRTLKGNEEAMRSSDIVIQIDQLRHGNANEGRMAEQKSIVRFREQSKNKLAYWYSDRIDQLAFLSLSGVPYTMKCSGGLRNSREFGYLEFAPTPQDAPTAKRFARWNGTSKQIEVGVGNGSITAADVPMWEMFVQMKAYAKENYIRGIREKGGEESFHVFLSPTAMAKLKLDPTYMQNLRHARERDKDNPMFSGSVVKIDGLYLHEFRHVINTRTAAPGSKWGAGGNVDGCQVLFCGAQALGMADLGAPEWDEEYDDYKNRHGIAIAKMLGFKKPKFYTQYSGGTVEDFGVISLYTAQ